MSHFSKILTCISNLEILKKTINDLGFKYKVDKYNLRKNKLDIYDFSIEDKLLFSFEFDQDKYVLIADLQLWSLNIDFNSFLEKLNQYYSYNIVLNQSQVKGFNKTFEKVMDDGSIKLVMEKWSD
uniref:Uncharacterized protein ycf35 n=1 Tax=Compsothamnion thuioides TaxID=3097386 RepID=A0A4D6WSF4_9FLOR|nr:hypothetical protein [Compsothamnion thuyoides]